MKFSFNIGRKYTQLPESVDDTVEILATRVGEVDSIEDLNKKYEGIVIGQIKDKREHPNADKLAIYNVDINEKENIQVVAGDKNLNLENKVAYIRPGSIVPSTYKKDPFEIKKTKLRGEDSEGMLCSEKELDIGPNHERVLVLNEDAEVGQSFAQYYEMNDIIVEIENKALTNRGDLFGILGISRELSAAQQLPFESPRWYRETENIKPKQTEIEAIVDNQAEALCSRYCALLINNVDVKESPIWLKSALLKLGIKPINNIVDITNYLMIISGQPMHAFDFNKVANGKERANIVVRMAEDKEKIHALDGNIYELSNRNLVIADDNHPIAIAGIIGGVDTQIDEKTKNVILECAVFDRYNIRKSSMELGIITDSSTRFTRPQSPEKCPNVILHAAHYIEDIGNGSIASSLIDSYPNPKRNISISINTTKLFQRLGINITEKEIVSILNNLEYKNIKVKKNFITVEVPEFRKDIEIEEDIYEDIFRIYGYEKIKPVLPKKEINAVKLPVTLSLKNKIRNILSYSGCNELNSYNFVSSENIIKGKQDPNQCFKIKNPLSKELEFMRPSIIISLLEKARINTQEGINSFGIYELGLAHQRNVIDKENLPLEEWKLSFIFSDKDNIIEGNPYYQAKRYLEKIFEVVKIDNLEFQLLSDIDSSDLEAWINIVSESFELNSSALIKTKVGSTDINLGVVGEINKEVKDNYSLNEFTSGFEINIHRLLDIIPKNVIKKQDSKFPYITQDICFITPNELAYKELYKEVEKAISENKLRFIIECLDIYEGEDKKITLRISISHIEKTLKDEDFHEIREKISKIVSQKGVSMLQ